VRRAAARHAAARRAVARGGVRRRLRLAAAALLVAGCAALAPPDFPPGTPMAEVEARMGKPPGVAKAPDGDTLWQFPTGQRTYVVRFGADQRVRSIEQVMTLQQFAKIRPGLTRDEVRALLGPPGQTTTFGRLNEEVWSYRYQASASDNRVFNVNFDTASGRVRSTGDQPDLLLNPMNFDASS
jgi:hypothetical protein